MINLTSRAGSSLILSFVVTVAIGGLVFLHLRNRPALASGDPCPAFRLHTVDGRWLTRDDLAGKDAALLFLHPSCRVCRSTLSRLCTANKPKARVILVSLADDSLTEAYAKSVCSLGTWTCGEDGAAWRLFGIRAIPTLVVLRPDGRVEHVSVGSNVSSDFFKYIGGHDEITRTASRGRMP